VGQWALFNGAVEPVPRNYAEFSRAKARENQPKRLPTQHFREVPIPPYLTLRDMDGCSFALFANRSLAEKIKVIHVSGNEYQLAEFTGQRIRIDKPNSDPYFPYPFSSQELSDPWPRITEELL
jgi:hypothetical protein